jgi:hypothetical protein
MSKKSALADPTRLNPIDSEDKQLLRVIIETHPRELVKSGRR